MRLEFRLLIVDDQPEQISGALVSFEDYLQGLGFELKKVEVRDGSRESIMQHTSNEGKNFDLCIVDYKLGMEGRDGADAAGDLRRQLPYVDIIFYSSSDRSELFDQLAQKQIEAAFVAHRDELDDSLRGVAGTVIGKVVDLCHMRGVAMSEVADLDVILGDILRQAFATDAEAFRAAAARTLLRLRQSAEQTAEKLKDIEVNGTIRDVLEDSHVFSYQRKVDAVGRIASSLTPPPAEAIKHLKAAADGVIKKRNKLAHAKELPDESGTARLQPARPSEASELIDDKWLNQFRVELREHRRQIHAVRDRILHHLGVATNQ